MSGLRVQITGSAASSCEPELLRVAHDFVRAVVAELISTGSGLVLGAGGEPRGDSGAPCIFDWTAHEVIAESADPPAAWPQLRRGSFVVVASQRGLEKIPEDRAAVWGALRDRSDFELIPAPPGWRMASIIRERQAEEGDILLALGGGAGVEHLAQQYWNDGKPVVPIHAELGAYNDDGRGGSRYLHERALAGDDLLLDLREGKGDPIARLSGLRLHAAINAEALARATVQLISDLRPRQAFYVRLLATDHDDYGSVEQFFRDVVDPVMLEREFTPLEVGRSKPQKAFMDIEIFERLHRAGLVVVDLTGVRPNCMMELGYALARRRRVVISARKGTCLPFDSDKLPTYQWCDGAPSQEEISRYLEWFDRYADLPSLVEPRS